MLMKGLGMREIDRYIKDEKKGRNHSGNHDRPKYFLHNGDNHPVPPHLHGDKPYKIPDYEYYGIELDPVTRKYLDEPGRSSEGLARNRITRRFEYDRSQWPRLGFISPAKEVRGRALRDEQEFKLWRYWHPRREVIEEMMDEDFDGGYNREYIRVGGNPRQRGRPPGIIEQAHRKGRVEPHRPHRAFATYDRPSHRQQGLIDITDPRNRPPYPSSGINSIQIAPEGLPNSIYQRARGRHPQRYPAGVRVPGFRDTLRAPHPAYETRGGYGEPSGRPGPHVHMRDNHGHRLGRRNPLIYDNVYETQDEGRPEFNHPDIHPHYPFTNDDEDEDEHDTHSHHSTGSYQRHRRGLSPDYVYPQLPPYYGRPLGHSRRNNRHELEFVDENEFEDELFSGRYVRPRRGYHGIGIGRRGYDGDDLNYGFSGDDDEFFAL